MVTVWRIYVGLAVAVAALVVVAVVVELATQGHSSIIDGCPRRGCPYVP